MAKSKPSADALAAELTTPVPRVPAIPDEDYLSTGSTLMNLAFSGRPRCGISKGTYFYLIGDSGTLKTWEGLCLFAEAAKNKQFDKYRFIFDNAENGALMDVPKFFGSGVAERIEPPAVRKGHAVYSETAQQFYWHLDRCCREGPCIYFLDSMDAINDDSDDDKFGAELKRYETGKGEVPGSMGMAKARTNSKNINRAARILRPNGCILIVISQTRSKIGGMFPGQKTRSGGMGLKFFAHIEAWTSIRGPITRRYLGKEREVGATIKIDVQKNRQCGWEGKFEVDFLKGLGIDDLGSMCNYLLEERHWKSEKPTSSSDDDDKKSKTVIAPEFDFSGTKDDLIKKIEDASDEWLLQKLVTKVWHDIIDQAAPNRKPRYG